MAAIQSGECSHRSGEPASRGISAGVFRVRCLWTACLFLVLGGWVPVRAFPLNQDKPVSTLQDAKVYREAMVWFKKAEAFIGTPKENSEEQADLFRKALAIKPDFVEAHYNLGLIYSNQKKVKEAVQEFETVLKLEPKFEGIHVLIASGYRELGNANGAISAL